MPDTRKHRGPHPADAELFGMPMHPVLREAVADLSWLLTRGYSDAAALKLVGDRFQLTQRQRLAVMRASCSDQSLSRRRENLIDERDVAGEALQLDGFNVLTTIEAALAGGVILASRDGCYRDMASMHGSYRKVEETRPALKLVGHVLAQLNASECCWFLDRPVSNSGRLSRLIRETATENGWNWQTELVSNPDFVLVKSQAIVASADSSILDQCQRWFNLARQVVDGLIPDAHVVALDS